MPPFSALLTAARLDSGEVVRMLLEWVGDDGQTIDVSGSGRPGQDILRYLETRFSHPAKDSEVLAMMLAWRGPGGAFIDLISPFNRELCKRLCRRVGHGYFSEGHTGMAPSRRHPGGPHVCGLHEPAGRHAIQRGGDGEPYTELAGQVRAPVGHRSDFDECVRAACRNPVPVDVLCALVTERVRCGSFHSWAEWTAAERVMFKSACMHANIIWSRRRRAWLGQKGLSP